MNTENCSLDFEGNCVVSEMNFRRYNSLTTGFRRNLGRLVAHVAEINYRRYSSLAAEFRRVLGRVAAHVAEINRRRFVGLCLNYASSPDSLRSSRAAV